MERLAGGTSSDDVLRYLRGVEFPTKKDRLVHAARQNGAPNDVVAALSALPATDYSSPEELIESYPHMEG
jgi:hypothetical protein